MDPKQKQTLLSRIVSLVKKDYLKKSEEIQSLDEDKVADEMLNQINNQ